MSGVWRPTAREALLAQRSLEARGMRDGDLRTAWETFVRRCGGSGNESLASVVSRLPRDDTALSKLLGQDAVRVGHMFIRESQKAS